MIETGSAFKIKAVRDGLISAAKKFDFKSALSLMDEHFGFRLGKIHLLLGSTGSGKSTMVRTFILDCIMSDEHFLTGVYLSEETEADFYTELGSTEIMNECYQKLHVKSEQDEGVKTAADFMKKLIEMAEAGCRIIFIDNITTERIYENAKPNEQGNIIDTLKKFATKRNIALVIVAHTSKGSASANNRLIDIEDVRGSGALPNAAPIAWTLQRVDCGGQRASIITIAKHRGYNITRKYFKGRYHRDYKIFGEFQSIPFSEVKDIFKNRDKL